MNGKLSEQPLAELIREILAKRMSGRLRVRHERIEAVIYFKEGLLIYAASNVRTLRLSEYLRSGKMITDNELGRFRALRSDLALAQAIGAEKLLPAPTLQKLQVKQVSDVLWVALLWTEGNWYFDNRSHLKEQVSFTIDTDTLLLEAGRRTPLNFATTRFGDPGEMIFPVADALTSNNLLPQEGFILSRVESPTVLSDLVALSGLPETDALRLIYALAVAGLLRREQWKEAFGNQAAQPRARTEKPVDGAEPGSEDLKSESSTASVVTQDNLEEFLERLSAATTHYEVLAVANNADSTEIKHAYYELARRYHPDKFRRQAASSMHARIDSAFARITQAYETLMDDKRRAGYDSKLRARARTKDFAQTAPKSHAPAQTGSNVSQVIGSDVSSSQRAEINFKEGFAALQQGQTNAAINLLSLAARAAPGESRYRAYYGHALAANENTRRLAEAELQAALKVEPGNAQYRLMLAELYRDLGFPRRARGEAERALVADPNNVKAGELLRTLK
jgi:curved DNA-binding protein CbpA